MSDNFSSEIETSWSRRDFLEFFGKTLAGSAALSILPSCVTPSTQRSAELPFLPLNVASTDTLRLTRGLNYQIVIKWGDALSKTEKFGSNSDYTAFIPLNESNLNEGLLWVNHESVDPIFASGYIKGKSRTKRQVDIERKEVGGSIVHIKKTDSGWKPVMNSPFNRRLDGTTPIPIISENIIAGSSVATGTLANCAGGVTPWKTILTCEENYQNFYGDVIFENGIRKRVPDKDGGYVAWDSFYPLPPEHYGWVVEIDPKFGTAKKLTALGRFSHECATTRLAADGRCVVYSGDDKEDEHIYKFISAKPGSLEKGELFVADTVNGNWLSLSRAKNSKLEKVFKNQTEVLIRTREAAKILGATPLNRPEDIEIDPKSGAVFATLTNNLKKGDLFGSILKITETGNDPTAMTFKATTFITGGTKFGFACPDNMVFDRKGNLWMTTDISGSKLNKGDYTPFGNNGLFYIPMSGMYAGYPIRVATAPFGAEFTGPSFSPDGKTLFLSVQHPGETSESIEKSISHWPLGGTEIPRSAVVAISGPALEAAMVL